MSTVFVVGMADQLALGVWFGLLLVGMVLIFVVGYVGLQAFKVTGRLIYHFARMLYVYNQVLKQGKFESKRYGVQKSRH